GCTVDLWDWAVRFLPTVLAANQQGMDGVGTHGVLQQLTLALPPPSDGEGILGMLLCLCVASLHQRMERGEDLDEPLVEGLAEGMGDSCEGSKVLLCLHYIPVLRRVADAPGAAVQLKFGVARLRRELSHLAIQCQPLLQTLGTGGPPQHEEASEQGAR